RGAAWRPSSSSCSSSRSESRERRSAARQRDAERASVLVALLERQRSARRFDRGLRNRKTEAAAGRIGGPGIRAKEPIEDVIARGLGNAGTAIDHVDDGPAIRLADADHDAT